MDSLWQLPEHLQYFQMLAKETEQNMEAVPPPLFLKFINLLKEMQTAQKNKEWDGLAANEGA